MERKEEEEEEKRCTPSPPSSCWDDALEYCIQKSMEHFRLFSPFEGGEVYEKLVDDAEVIVKRVEEKGERDKAALQILPLYNIGMLLIPNQSSAVNKREKIENRKKEFYSSLGVEIEKHKITQEKEDTQCDFSIIEEHLTGDREVLRRLLKNLTSFKSLQKYQPEMGDKEMISESFLENMKLTDNSSRGMLDVLDLCCSFIPPKPFFPLHLVFTIMSIFERVLEDRSNDVGIWGDYLTFITNHLLRVAVYIKGLEEENTHLSTSLFEMAEKIFQCAVENTKGAVRPLCMYVEARKCVLTAFGTSTNSQHLSLDEAWELVSVYLFPEMETFSTLPDRPEMFECVLGLLGRSYQQDTFSNIDKTLLVSKVAFRVCHEFLYLYSEKKVSPYLCKHWTELFFDALSVLEMLGLNREVQEILFEALKKKEQHLHLVPKNKRFMELLVRCEAAALFGESEEKENNESGTCRGIIDKILKHKNEEIDTAKWCVFDSECDVKEMKRDFKLTTNTLNINPFNYNDYMLGLDKVYKKRKEKGPQQHLFTAIDEYLLKNENVYNSVIGKLMNPVSMRYPLKYIRYLFHSSESVIQKRDESRDITFVYSRVKNNNNNNNNVRQRKRTSRENEMLNDDSADNNVEIKHNNKKTPKNEVKGIRTNDDFLKLITGK